MITKTPYTASDSDIKDSLLSLPSQESGKQTINQPTGNFFYDPWEIKPEYKGTAWERLLNSLGVTHGEARVITLESKTNYVSHSDIDDRYHLNLSGVNCYLIDLDTDTMYKVNTDKIWYLMDTSKLHTAANFGNRYRHQLVVRNLLTKHILINPVTIRVISTINDLDEARFAFDHSLSSLLNIASKQGLITDFELTKDGPQFKCEKTFLNSIRNSLSHELEVVLI